MNEIKSFEAMVQRLQEMGVENHLALAADIHAAEIMNLCTKVKPCDMDNSKSKNPRLDRIVRKLNRTRSLSGISWQGICDMYLEWHNYVVVFGLDGLGGSCGDAAMIKFSETVLTFAKKVS